VAGGDVLTRSGIAAHRVAATVPSQVNVCLQVKFGQVMVIVVGWET
jgi:hypothetical protein